MTESRNDPPSGDAPLELALERWFLAVDSGVEPDAAVICGGDQDLVARLTLLVGSEGRIVERLAQTAGGAGSTSDGLNGPERIGDFRILSTIGAGGMAHVFVAWQESLKRTVALKIVDAPLARDRAARLRFEREIQATAIIDHP